MTTTTRLLPGSDRQPKARPERRSRERPRGTGEDAAVPAREAAPRRTAPKESAPKNTASGKTASTSTPARAAAAKARQRAGGSRKARGVAQAPPRAPFVLLIVGLLGGALVSLLLLNTVLAKDAFTLTRLQQSNKMLEQQRQASQEEIAREDSPESLSRKAKALGLKEREGLAFVDGDTGQTTGGAIRPVPYSAAASAGAASVLGIPGTTVPGDGVPAAVTGGGRSPQGTGARPGTGAQ